MKYVFFGTPEFAAIILQKLIDAGLTPAAVVCNPDRPVGRKKTVTPPPVKQLIANGKLQIEILQPDDLNAIRHKLFAIKPDVFVVAAYAKILSKEILEIPRLGVIGVHPSLLPKYRGPSPIQSALLNGETETGITIYLLDEKMDHGSILASKKLKIEVGNAIYPELQKELAELGGEFLAEALPRFAAGELKPETQDESRATYTKKFVNEDAYVEPLDLEKAEKNGGLTVLEIERKIRALNPEPGVWTIKNGKRLKLLEARIADGKLKIEKLQLEGQKPRFLNIHDVKIPPWRDLYCL